MMKLVFSVTAATAAALLPSVALLAQQAGLAPPVYSAAQAQRGADLYQEKCTACHGADLGAGEFGPSLKGVRFKQDWGGKPATQLFDYLSHNMPPNDAASVTPEEHAALLAYILRGNGVPAGASDLPADAKAIAGAVPK
jgi:mono/diheme cytochrome c family protein